MNQNKEEILMRIVMLEPLGVPEQTVLEIAKPLTNLGHEFIFCGTKLSEAQKSNVLKTQIFLLSRIPH